MSKFLKETITGKKFELLIDTQIFDKYIILKSAYNFLDRGYFFFMFDADKNIILEFSPKPWVDIDPQKIIGDFSDELLNVCLRDRLQKDNKVVIDAIVTKALSWPLDLQNFVAMNTDALWNDANQNEIDFDKDIDDILKEIEEDPDLQIDDEKIDKVLKQIEQDTWLKKPKIQVDVSSITSIKDSFKKK